MSYEDKTKEELIDLLDIKDDEIETLERDRSDYEASEEEVESLNHEVCELRDDISDKLELIEKAFYAGGNCAISMRYSTPLKAWLNYKIGERL